jgi:hypothetical protein
MKRDFVWYVKSEEEPRTKIKEPSATDYQLPATGYQLWITHHSPNPHFLLETRFLQVKKIGDDGY